MNESIEETNHLFLSLIINITKNKNASYIIIYRDVV